MRQKKYNMSTSIFYPTSGLLYVLEVDDRAVYPYPDLPDTP